MQAAMTAATLGRIKALRDNVTAERQAEIDAELARQEADAIQRRLDAVGLPRRFLSAEVTLPETSAWVGAVKAGEGGNLLLQGRPGTGKTREACAALIALASSKLCRFATFGDILRSVQATYSGDGDEGAVLRSWGNCGVLCIDDLGKERATPYAVERLFAVVNDRYNRMKPTVFTTQYSYRQLIERLCSDGGDRQTADAIARRVYEGARVVTLR